MEKKIKLILTEDVNLVRKSLLALLKNYPWIQVTGEAQNERTLFDLLKNNEVDIVLLDLEMSSTEGKGILKKLSQRFENVRVILLSVNFDMANIIDCISLGAKSYLSKNCMPEELIRAILTVNEKGFYLEESISNSLLRSITYEASISKDKKKFSKRELEIIKEVVNGNTESEIAAKLNISIHTVHFHRMNIYSKSNTHNISSLLKYLKENGIM